MDRATYVKIRSSLNLEKKSSALFFHIMQNVVLAAMIEGLWVSFRDSGLKYLAVPLVFTLIFRNFAIMHDAVHGAAAKNRILNDAVGIIGGGFCLLPFETWKQSHLNHHQWSGNVEKDPVMALIIFFPKMPKSLQNFISISWQCWLPVLGFLQHVVFWNLSLKIYFKQKNSFKVLLSLVFPVVLWGMLFCFLPSAFAVHILLPALFMYFIGIEVVNLPHHLQLPQFRGEEKFLAWQQYQTARSCSYPKWFAKFIVLNFNLHIEHHMFPDVPWYHLDKLNEPVKDALKDLYNTDQNFAWILENKPKAMAKVLSPAEKNKKTANKRAA